MPELTQEIMYRGPRDVRPVQINQLTAHDVDDLGLLGIGIPDHVMRNMMASASAIGMDALQPTITTGNLGTPVQFLQQWLPGFVNVVTAARKIDELIGIFTGGQWSDEEVIQGVMEQTGTAVPYGDLTNVPLSSYNATYDRRTNVRFEEGMRVGRLEEDRASRQNINSAQQKRESAALALEIQRNAVGFLGYNNGGNRTYGFLNDPNLPGYVSSPGGTWVGATFQTITAALRAGYSALRTQSQDIIDPMKTPITLAVSTNRADYLTVESDLGISVLDWIKQNYPQTRIVSAPELNGANASANVWYMYAESVADSSTDGGRVWLQVVPSKFQMLGVMQMTKGYEEDYSNATAGALLKRPWAVVRYSGN